MKLKWITLLVKNLDESIKFYNEVLNLPIYSKFSAGANKIAMMGDVNKPKIELIEQKDRRFVNFGEGVSIGLGVENLDKTINELEKLGIEISKIISPMENVKFCFINDPNNYKIQLIEEK
ncbi:VOC family protein [Miniphocaeibacter halophilus]|uniref:VOC family protein n=1 Tax=Miniphocaeibacter halophilus TaxID=2931922 RepID=A0AC61MT66_9FIRM|nr:VOC family protein [Miniphocaeibacter halophilus]QQK08812.1 VOC family protein [Miniphocaeibacter halophilus]